VTRRPPRTGSLDTALDALVSGLDHASWFTSLGDPLSPSERADAEGYLAGLGFAGIEVHGVADWDEARIAIQNPDWDKTWWDATERERQALLLDAKSAHTDTILMDGLSRVTQAATKRLSGLAAEAAARGGIADQGLIKAASGAASEAAYQAALALAAAAPASHPFRLKYNLFEAGHWPLAVIGNRFDLF
jgi:hypothetical protein